MQHESKMQHFGRCRRNTSLYANTIIDRVKHLNLIITMPSQLNPINEANIERALEFLAQNPSEKSVTASRIFKVNHATLRSRQRRQRQSQTHAPGSGGCNKMLSGIQEVAIQRYIQRSYESGYGATRPMVFEAICDLIAPRRPSQRWFQQWISTQTEHFHVVKTRPIERARVSAHQIEDVHAWFNEYEAFCTQLKVESANIFNFDEVGFRVGIASGQEVLVPKQVKEVYTST